MGLLYVVTFVMLLVGTEGATEYTSAEQTAILNKHNNYRTNVNPAAASMQELVWDDDLADKAQVWSDKCLFEHPNKTVYSEYKDIGQNLYIEYWSIPQPDSPPAVTKGVEAWYNETYDYNYNSNSCQSGKVCGHYTQIIWESTTSVGCGIKYCPTATAGSITYANAWLVTCNYGPPGNYVGQKPYVSGNYCSKCGEGVYCKDKMCSDCSSSETGCECRIECECGGTKSATTCSCNCPNGYYGTYCENYCQDTHMYCNANPGWPASLCDDPQWSYVPEKCPSMCGVCTSGPKNDNC